MGDDSGAVAGQPVREGQRVAVGDGNQAVDEDVIGDVRRQRIGNGDVAEEVSREDQIVDAVVFRVVNADRGRMPAAECRRRAAPGIVGELAFVVVNRALRIRFPINGLVRHVNEREGAVRLLEVVEPETANADRALVAVGHAVQVAVPGAALGVVVDRLRVVVDGVELGTVKAFRCHHEVLLLVSRIRDEGGLGRLCFKRVDSCLDLVPVV